MKKFYKTLDNGKEVFDFKKIKDYGFPINIIISMRGGLGKSTNAKIFLKQEWDKVHSCFNYEPLMNSLINTYKQQKHSTPLKVK